MLLASLQDASDWVATAGTWGVAALNPRLIADIPTGMPRVGFHPEAMFRIGFYPEGITAISLGLSAATPQVWVPSRFNAS